LSFPHLRALFPFVAAAAVVVVVVVSFSAKTPEDAQRRRRRRREGEELSLPAAILFHAAPPAKVQRDSPALFFVP